MLGNLSLDIVHCWCLIHSREDEECLRFGASQNSVSFRKRRPAAKAKIFETGTLWRRGSSSEEARATTALLIMVSLLNRPINTEYELPPFGKVPHLDLLLNKIELGSAYQLAEALPNARDNGFDSQLDTALLSTTLL